MVTVTSADESETNVIIEVEIKNVYGNEAIYPVNEAAATFARIAGTKTLKRDTIRLAQSLGFTVRDVTPQASF